MLLWTTNLKLEIMLLQNNDIIYLLDTINLPIIDDFSTNKFKSYLSDTSASNIMIAAWCAI